MAEIGPRIAVILAGGGGKRMGGADKGELTLAGARLIDWVLERLGPQVEEIVISGRHDYGTGLAFAPDRDDGPKGPAAGLWAALHWIEENRPDAKGFLTVPVDGPFFPHALFDMLAKPQASIIAATASGPQPTYAWWLAGALRDALALQPAGYGWALKELADAVRAERALFAEEEAFLNINTQEDLALAEERARDEA